MGGFYYETRHKTVFDTIIILCSIYSVCVSKCEGIMEVGRQLGTN